MAYQIFFRDLIEISSFFMLEKICGPAKKNKTDLETFEIKI